MSRSRKSPSPGNTGVFLLSASLAATMLSGCAGISSSPSAGPLAAGATIRGTVHGGQQPVIGTRIYLMSAGMNGYGSASNSLLSTSANGVLTDSNGNGYVLTDSSGSFTITGDYTCSNSIAQTYLLALGGNPGLSGGTNNSAISLMAALGTCGSLSASTQTNLNELTTAASVLALQQFMLDTTHIGASSSNSAGIANAFVSINNIVDSTSGTARSANLAGTGVVPSAKLNTLGDILAPCINSAGPSSTACSNLFSASTPSGGTAPTDVASAMLLIAQNPSNNVSALYNQISPASPFQPTLPSAPNDYTVGITYTGGGLAVPGAIIIDANGNAFVANCPSCNSLAGQDSIVGFGPQGSILTGTAGYTAGIHMPKAIAFDQSGYLWSTDLASGSLPDQVVKQTPGGTLVSGFPFHDGTISGPMGIALDSSGSAWVSNQTANSAVKISSTGTRLVGPVTSPGFTGANGVAIDGIGVIFVAGTSSSSILKFDSSGNVLSGSGAGFTGGGLAGPQQLAINNADDLWTVNSTSETVSEIYGSNGTDVTGSGGYSVGLTKASMVSIDGLGNAWIANCRANCGGSASTPDNLVHLRANGALATGATGYQDTHFATVGATAIDPSGNLWVSNASGASVTELLGVAAPVKTPLSAAANNQLGSRP